jgi:cytokinin dehydrogenase
VRGGIVADMSRLRSIGPVRGDRVVVEAGAKWSELLARTLARGKTPPVLTDYLELSVGGTLAVGGVGGTSMSLGVQTDHVLQLEVVTGDGELVTCSATRNADLFDPSVPASGRSR